MERLAELEEMIRRKDEQLQAMLVLNSRYLRALKRLWRKLPDEWRKHPAFEECRCGGANEQA